MAGYVYPVHGLQLSGGEQLFHVSLLVRQVTPIECRDPECDPGSAGPMLFVNVKAVSLLPRDRRIDEPGLYSLGTEIDQFASFGFRQ